MQIRRADFARDEAAIRAVRFTVFVDEQRVPADIEMDDRDAHCVHLLAYDAEEPVGTGRIDIEKDGKIGRLAVLSNARLLGVGTALMTELHAIARAHALRHVWCHAQVAAAPFYAKLGYRVSGAPFYEAGIEHVRMERAL
jgi:predicted GNAT family N-acyltransferase